MIHHQDVRLFSYWNVQFKAFFFFPSVGIFHFILSVISFWTVKHGKPGVMLSLVVQLLVLQSLTFIGSLCCRSVGEEGRRSRAVKQILLCSFLPLLPLTVELHLRNFCPCTTAHYSFVHANSHFKHWATNGIRKLMWPKFLHWNDLFGLF